MLIVKGRLKMNPIPPMLKAYPRTDQWLRVVGVAEHVSEVMIKAFKVID